MKNRDRWQPSKYVLVRGKLAPSRDARELSPASRLIGKLLTDLYQPAFSAHSRGELLDLGCGKVPFYAAYSEYVDDNTCVDWPGSPHTDDHVDRFCDLSEPLPFADASFDTILSSDVIEHLPDPVLAFQEMGRLLKPGGKLILNTPFLYMLHEVPHDYYRHTRYSLERLTRLAGLETLQLVEIGGLGEVFCDLLGKALLMVPGIGKVLSALAQSSAMLLSRTRLWQHLRRRSAPRFPIGYFLVARKPGTST